MVDRHFYLLFSLGLLLQCRSCKSLLFSNFALADHLLFIKSYLKVAANLEDAIAVYANTKGCGAKTFAPPLPLDGGLESAYVTPQICGATRPLISYAGVLLRIWSPYIAV